MLRKINKLRCQKPDFKFSSYEKALDKVPYLSGTYFWRSKAPSHGDFVLRLVYSDMKIA